MAILASLVLVGYGFATPPSSGVWHELVREAENIFSLDHDLRSLGRGDVLVCEVDWENFAGRIDDYYITVTLRRSHSLVNQSFSASDFVVQYEGGRSSFFESVESLNNSSNRPQRIHSEGDKGFNQIIRLRLSEGGRENVLHAINELNQLNKVLAAEPVMLGVYAISDTVEDELLSPNLILPPGPRPPHLFPDLPTTPNDPLFNRQWGLSRINIADAWRITRGSRNVRVGIMEGGVQDHPDLNANLLRLRGSYTATSVHGTQVAGVVGAVQNNNEGIAGVGNVSLVPLSWDETNRGFANTIQFAIDNNIWIINASFRWVLRDERGNIIGNAPPTVAQAAAIDEFIRLGGVFIASAGNQGDNIAVNPQFPAAYPGVIAVGASNRNDNRSIFNPSQPSSSSSNFGIGPNGKAVDLFAPGSEILTTTERFRSGIWPFQSWNYYREVQGTSFAAPMVAGVAALMRTVNPCLSSAQITQILRNTVDHAVSLSTLSISGGRLNAYRAVRTAMETITTAQQLDTIVRANPYGNFRLVNSIDLRDLGRDWTPIPMFRGTFDGGWHHIRGLRIINPTIPNSTTRFGLFERNYGTIRNFRMTAVDIRIDNRNESHLVNIGAIAGLNGGQGRIENVWVTGVLRSYRRNSSLGGVVGDNHGRIHGSRFTHYVSRAAIYGHGDMGGVAGRSFNGAQIHNSRVYRAGVNHAHASSNRAIGGLVGYSRGTCLVGNFLSHTTIAYVGPATLCNKAPMIGMKVGFFNGSLINMATSDHDPNTMLLNSGNLQGQQLRNFGQTPGNGAEVGPGGNIDKVHSFNV